MTFIATSETKKKTSSPPFSPVAYPALYTVYLGDSIGSQYAPVLDDIVRVLCIQLAVQVMLYFSGASRRLLTAELLMVSLFMIVGVALYWLVFKSLVRLR